MTWSATSYVRSRAVAFGIEPPLFDRRDIDVHVPEGGAPEGRPVGGRRHGERHRLGAHRHPGAA
jgi:ATP-dependent Lon protease